jgi:hypothetical protein
MNTAHPSPTSGASQCARILAVLTSRTGEWVPMTTLYAKSGAFAVHSRIADLRRAGHIIHHRNLRFGKNIHSEYMLETQDGKTQDARKEQARTGGSSLGSCVLQS